MKCNECQIDYKDKEIIICEKCGKELSYSPEIKWYFDLIKQMEENNIWMGSNE